MAKKVVATLQGSSKKMVKAIKLVKSKKSNAFVFEEKVLNADDVDAFFKN